MGTIGIKTANLTEKLQSSSLADGEKDLIIQNGIRYRILELEGERFLNLNRRDKGIVTDYSYYFLDEKIINPCL